MLKTLTQTKTFPYTSINIFCAFFPSYFFPSIGKTRRPGTRRHGDEEVEYVISGGGGQRRLVLFFLCTTGIAVTHLFSITTGSRRGIGITTGTSTNTNAITNVIITIL